MRSRMRLLGKLEKLIHSGVKFEGKGELELWGYGSGIYGIVHLSAAVLSVGGSIDVLTREQEGSCL